MCLLHWPINKTVAGCVHSDFVILSGAEWNEGSEMCDNLITYANVHIYVTLGFDLYSHIHCLSLSLFHMRAHLMYFDMKYIVKFTPVHCTCILYILLVVLTQS